METVEDFISIKERDTLDLLELVCKLYYRVLSQPGNKYMHDAYMEARQEMEFRIRTAKI